MAIALESKDALGKGQVSSMALFSLGAIAQFRSEGLRTAAEGSTV